MAVGICVVCNEICTDGDIETPVVIQFDTKEEARKWVRNDVAHEREIARENWGVEDFAEDKGDLDTKDGSWWRLTRVCETANGDYENIMTWDIVDIFT